MEITAYTSFLLVWAVNLFSVCPSNTLVKEAKEKKKKKEDSSPESESAPGVSVVILTQNQEQKLVRLLEDVLKQTYDSFEIVVVDNNSTDNTRIILENMEKRYDRLQYTFVPKDTRHVSAHTLALTLGVKAARYPWVLLIQPDFLPVSDQWLHSMASKMKPGKDFVLGARTTSKNSSSLRSFRYLTEQCRFLSWACRHRAFCANEVNLAFRKELLLSSKHFGEYGILLSGVESIFVNRFSHPESTAVCVTPESLILETECETERNGQEEQLIRKETEHFFTHKSLYRLRAHLRMGMIWLLFLLSITSLGLSIVSRHWEVTAALGLLMGVWSYFRTRNLKEKAALFQIKSAGIFLPFYELRLSCADLLINIRYAFVDKKRFYRKLFH